MRNLFFYGSLRLPELLEIVLGGDVAGLDISTDQLADHAVLSVAEGPFPLIEAQPGAQAIGLLVRNLRQDQIDRLDFYEGSFAYDLTQMTLTSGAQAQVYFPQTGKWQGLEPWDFEAWCDHWAEMSCQAAREAMGYFGSRTATDVARMFPVIRARAWSRVNAVHSKHGDATNVGQVEVTAKQRSYSNFYALDDIHLRHTLFDGSWSPEIERGVFYSADAALVLPYDPVRDCVMLVEQFRVGPFARGDQRCWQFEPIAGRLDPGETPEQAARREAEEEAGLSIGTLEKVGETYASPGNSSEFYYTFVGIADLPDDCIGTGGLEAEGEDIRSHLLSFDALMELCDSGQAANTPLVMAAYWLARHRSRLRLQGQSATPDPT